MTRYLSASLLQQTLVISPEFQLGLWANDDRQRADILPENMVQF